MKIKITISPNMEFVQNVANYFGVTTDELLKEAVEAKVKAWSKIKN